MLKICDTEELRKALVTAGLTQDQFSIVGEDIKQDDGTWLHACELRCDDPAAQAIFQTQQKRDWKTWRAARDQLLAIEQKSGTTRRDREINLKLFKQGDFQFNSAKMVEDQIEPLRQKMRDA